MITKCVFPVGGLGTRFLPATKSMPKEMLPVVDKPLIQYGYEEAMASGCSKFIFVTGRNKNAIENHFDLSYELESVLSSKNKEIERRQTTGWLSEPGDIVFTRQQQPLGLGHAVWCARNMINDEPFAVILADDLIMADTPAIKQMVDVYQQTGGNVVALCRVGPEDIHKFGVISPESSNGNVFKANAIVEKPKAADAPSDLAVVGRYILHPSIFKALEQKRKGAGGEIQLTDALSDMLGSTPLHGVLLEGKRYDCGDKAGFIEANVAYALKHPEIGEQVRGMLKDIETSK